MRNLPHTLVQQLVLRFVLVGVPLPVAEIVPQIIFPAVSPTPARGSIAATRYITTRDTPGSLDQREIPRYHRRSWVVEA